MQVDVQAAGAQLSRMIDAALGGKDVVIARDSIPLVRLVPVRAGPFKLGLLADRIDEGLDFLERPSDAELASWEGG